MGNAYTAVFCSMIPYATDLVSGDFSNKLAQGFYGIFVICVTLANIGLSMVLQEVIEMTNRVVLGGVNGFFK